MWLKLSFRRYWVESAIEAAGYIGSAAINALSQHKTNAANREQAEYAFRQQQLAIERQNEYNSPASQVLRMEAAGLNPSLAYGADGNLVGNQADVPAYNAIPAEAPSIGNLGAALHDAISTGIDVRDLERRQSLAKAELALKDAQTFAEVMKGNLDDATRTDILSMLGYKMDLAESELALNDQSIKESIERVENLKAERNEIQSRIGLNEQQIKSLAAQYHLTEVQAYAILQKLPSEILLMDADAALARMNTDVAREQVFKIAKETSHIGWAENFQVKQFNTDLKQWKIENQKWVEQMNQNRRMHLIDGISNVLGFTTGALLMRNGMVTSARQRQPSPIITPSGGSMFGQSWSQ